MPDGPNAGQSYEAWVESMAGASPRETPEEWDARNGWDWPMPVPPPYEADDEDEATPDA